MDTPAPPHSSPKAALGKGVSSLKKLPPWAMILVAGAVLLFVLYRRKQQAAAQAAADSAAANSQDQTATDPGTSTYGTVDPSLYGGLGYGALPNGAGVASNPADLGGLGGNTTTGATNTITGGTDSHDSTSTDSHDTTYTLGDINSPLSTGGGPPNRPNSHTPPKTKPKPKVPAKPKTKAKKGYHWVLKNNKWVQVKG